MNEINECEERVKEKADEYDESYNTAVEKTEEALGSLASSFIDTMIQHSNWPYDDKFVQNESPLVVKMAHAKIAFFEAEEELKKVSDGVEGGTNSNMVDGVVPFQILCELREEWIGEKKDSSPQPTPTALQTNDNDEEDNPSSSPPSQYSEDQVLQLKEFLEEEMGRREEGEEKMEEQARTIQSLNNEILSLKDQLKSSTSSLPTSTSSSSMSSSNTDEEVEMLKDSVRRHGEALKVKEGKIQELEALLQSVSEEFDTIAPGYVEDMEVMVIFGSHGGGTSRRGNAEVSGLNGSYSGELNRISQLPGFSFLIFGF